MPYLMEKESFLIKLWKQEGILNTCAENNRRVDLLHHWREGGENRKWMSPKFACAKYLQKVK